MAHPDAWRVLDFTTLPAAPFSPLWRVQQILQRAVHASLHGRHSHCLSLDLHACRQLWECRTEGTGGRAPGVTEFLGSLSKSGWEELRHLRAGWLSVDEVQSLLRLGSLQRLEFDFRYAIRGDARRNPVLVVRDERIRVGSALISNLPGAARARSCHGDVFTAAAAMLACDNVRYRPPFSSSSLFS